MRSVPGPVLVYGAGAIGQFLAAALADAGCRVHCVARAPVVQALRERGLRMQRIDGRTVQVAAGAIGASETLAEAPSPALVLLTVKSAATRDAGADLAAHCPSGTPLISFQNGIDNPERLRAAAPPLTVLTGMVPFNVVQPEPGVVRQATEGQLACEDHPAARVWTAAFAAAGLPLALHADMLAVQWGKLLLNLNNPVNALAGIPLREQLLRRGYRRVLATLQGETLGVLARAGIRPAKVTPLPPSLLPRLLRLPTPLFRALAARMLKIAPEARSSMYDDRVAGRTTEIDELCGAVIRLAEANGIDAPCNRRIRDLVLRAPKGRYYSEAELLATLRG